MGGDALRLHSVFSCPSRHPLGEAANPQGRPGWVTSAMEDVQKGGIC